MKKQTLTRWLCAVAVLGLAACNDSRAPAGIDPDAIDLGDTSGDVSGDGGSDAGVDTTDDVDPDATVDVIEDTVEDAMPDAMPDVGADVDPDADPDSGVDVGPDAGAICGDGVVDDGEECDDGEANGDAPDACREDCTLPFCGDGIVDSEEGCDEGDGNSDDAPDACRTDCQPAFCGDGVVDAGEDCDDGNDVDNDACANSCVEVLGSLCSPCDGDDACGRESDLCVDLGGDSFCAIDCAETGECPDGFSCEELATDDGFVTNQCVPVSGVCEPCLDLDGDGYGIGPECLGLDCNDDDPEINEGATELCDGIDNDCSGAIDDDAEDGVTYFADADEDGFGDDDTATVLCAPTDELPVDIAGDCDDDDFNVNPDGVEVCDGVDNDCDADTDDGAADGAIGLDCDGDDADLCADGTAACIDGAIVCDDDAASEAEVCDGEDNDCNPDTPDGADDAEVGVSCDSDDPDECAAGVTMCVDGGLACMGDAPAEPEVCDGRDNDCDGEIDNDASDATMWFVDADGDGVGTGEGVMACDPPGDAYAAIGGDCDDDNPDRAPGFEEVCDGIDNDCDEEVDNDAVDATTWYRDADGDGYGGDPSATVACDPPADDWIDIGGDCNNFDEDRSPGLDEVCDDRIDNDCDTRIDCDDPDCATSAACGDFSCVDEDLGDGTGAGVTDGTNEGAGGDTTASCGGFGADVAFTWEAPADGTYVIDTFGSDFDTVLYLLDECEGEELACNNNAGGGNQSEVVYEATEGEVLVIVVDGAGGGSTGDFELNIEAIETGLCDDGEDNDDDGDTDCEDSDCWEDEACFAWACPSDDLGTSIGNAVATGNTEDDGVQSAWGSCGGGGSTGDPRGGVFAPDVAYTWTAPETSTYTFDLSDSDYDTLLYVFEGLDCSGDEVACDDDGGSGNRSEVEIEAERGDSFVIVVDGWNASAGDYELDIDAVEAGYCDDELDNDGDGDVDCDDGECATLEACCPADVFEPNQGTGDAPSTLYSVYAESAGSTLRLSGGDVDSFNIPICDGSTVSAVARFAHAEGNIDLWLRDTYGRNIIRASSTTDNETISEDVDVIRFPGAQPRVFLQAFLTGDTALCAEYTLEITVEGCD